MKLTAGSHSEIEGEGAQSNVLHHSAADRATDDGAAGNAESVASQVSAATVPQPREEHNPKAITTPRPANANAEVAEQPGADADVDSQRQQTPTDKQQPRRSAVISEYNNKAYPALCRPYANVSACACMFAPRVCVPFQGSAI